MEASISRMGTKRLKKRVKRLLRSVGNKLIRRPEPGKAVDTWVAPTTLRVFHFEIVRGCQLRCVGCPISTRLPKVERVSVDLFDRCLRNLDVKHVEEFRLFNFGEPLLHKQLPELLTRIPQQTWGVDRVEISTNGQAVNWDMFAEAVKLRVLTHLVISCDGNGTPEEYERLRPPGKWKKLLAFLEGAADLRDRYDPNLQVEIRSIITEQEDKQRWEQVVKPFGIKTNFRPWMWLPEGAQNMTGREMKVGQGVCLFQETANQLYVDCEGRVVPCCAHPEAGILGSLEYQTFSEVLRGRLRTQFLDKLAIDRPNMPVCNECEFGPASDGFSLRI